MDKKFSVKDISQILNVSIQTVHFYEKKGVISPERNKKNNYREFSTSDLFDLYNALKYNRLGFTVRDIVDFRNDLEKNNMVIDLQKKVKEKKEKIQFEMASCELMDFIIQESINSKNKLNKPELINESLDLYYADITASLKDCIAKDYEKIRVISALGIFYEFPIQNDKKSIIYFAKLEHFNKVGLNIKSLKELKKICIQKYIQVYVEIGNDESIDEAINSQYLSLNKKYKLLDEVIAFPLLYTEREQLDNRRSCWKVIFVMKKQ